ncbi:hypothetical protein PAXRUDRAFT_621907 [Paxillus rubicundulus Ve08.2h10]|uniref:Uncharacterized protein n=1 Tax=Paxillus rubicundulus Ve08.2h10 TaxID=930991 RepID=A0A0D0DKB0_9AGAM|nr:hypothetical protein PAXRUDRAFT_621907 [Paxillus rubicundulus Ve08.2h10]
MIRNLMELESLKLSQKSSSMIKPSVDHITQRTWGVLSFLRRTSLSRLSLYGDSPECTPIELGSSILGKFGRDTYFCIVDFTQPNSCLFEITGCFKCFVDLLSVRGTRIAKL